MDSKIPPYSCVARNHQRVRIVELYERYSEFSIAIVNAARSGDKDVLRRAVAKDAEFNFIIGDVGTGEKIGPEGALAFFGSIQSDQYRYQEAGAGPQVLDPCEDHTIELDLISDEGHETVGVTFSFSKGRLVKALASSRTYVEGKLVEKASG